MRILYHHRTLADGAEGIHIASMVAAFRELGHDVVVDGVMPGVSGHSERSRWVQRFRAATPQAIFELASAGYNVPEYLRTARLIERFKPDVLYKRHSRFDVGALEAAKRHHLPTVLEVNALFTGGGYHMFEPLSLPAFARTLERRALRTATRVIAVSTPLARQVRALAAVDVSVMPNGADPVRFDPGRVNGSAVRAKYGLGEAVVVGWSGILREWHGLELLLESAARLPSSILLIVGDGPARPAVENQIVALGLSGRVVITGRVPYEHMPEHIAGMDIAVVADEKTGMASPMKMLEYMSMGVPVVAPAIENVRDVVDDGMDGLLFAPGDAQDLSKRIAQLSADAGLRRAIGASARQKIERQRNWRCIAMDVLRSIDALS